MVLNQFPDKRATPFSMPFPFSVSSLSAVLKVRVVQPKLFFGPCMIMHAPTNLLTDNLLSLPLFVAPLFSNADVRS